jgi:membrane associated rhomboid family serine protease
MPFDNIGRPGPGRGAGERAINLPPAVLWLIVINVAVHLLRSLLGDETDNNLVMQLVAPVTYQFIHGGWMHLVVNMVTLAAFGAPVERLLGVRRFVLFYLSAGVVAGFVQVLLFPESGDPVVGASGAISGVFGGVLMLMRRVGSLPGLLPVAVIWIGLNVFFGIVGGMPGAGGEQIAWAAHIGGFLYGLLTIHLFLPRPPRLPAER